MKKLKLNQKGQGMMEYIILSSLIGLFCLVAVKQFGGVLKKRVEYMKSHVAKNISIGN